MGIFRRKKKGSDDEQVDPDDRSPQLGLKYKDLAVMGQLMDNGADFDEPRHVLHFSSDQSHDHVRRAPAGWTSS